VGVEGNFYSTYWKSVGAERSSVCVTWVTQQSQPQWVSNVLLLLSLALENYVNCKPERKSHLYHHSWGSNLQPLVHQRTTLTKPHSGVRAPTVLSFLRFVEFVLEFVKQRQYVTIALLCIMWIWCLNEIEYLRFSALVSWAAYQYNSIFSTYTTPLQTSLATSKPSQLNPFNTFH
jgi:hypothetical protein